MITEKKQQVLDWIKAMFPTVFAIRHPEMTLYSGLNKRFSCFLNENFLTDLSIFKWNYSNHVSEHLPFDCILLGDYNCGVIIDEYFKFSSIRGQSLEFYNKELNFGFDINEYIKLCGQHSVEADEYQRLKKRGDFNFEGGAIYKRATLDLMADYMPIFFNKKPTIRLHQFELEAIDSFDSFIFLWEEKLKKISFSRGG